MPKKFFYSFPRGLLPAFVLTFATAALILWMKRYPVWPDYTQAYTFKIIGPVPVVSHGGAEQFWSLVRSEIISIIVALASDLIFFLLNKRIFNIAGSMAAFACGTLFSLLALTAIGGPDAPEHLNTFLPGTPSPWIIWGSIGFGLMMAVLAYRIEQHRPYPDLVPTPRTVILPDLSRRQWVYWEKVGLGWLNYTLFLFMIQTSTVLNIIKASSRFSTLGLCALIFLPISAFLGGFSLSITPKRLMLHLGWLRIPFLILPIGRITQVEALDFKLTTEFGGWGIRHASKLGWGFIWGEKGIRVETTSGRIVTISSQHPEELAGLLNRLIICNNEKVPRHA